MRDKGTMIRVFVLLAMILTFFAYDGLPTNKSNADGKLVRADEESVDWGAKHFMLIDYPEPVDAADHPDFGYFKETAIISNSDFFWNSALFLQGAPNPDYPIITGIYIDNNSYVFMGGGITSTNEIIVDNNSKVCSTSSLTAMNGDIIVRNNSVLYLEGAITASAANIEIDETSTIYLKTGTDKYAGGLIINDDRIIELSEEDYREATEIHCYKTPDEVPPRLVGELSAEKNAVIDEEKIDSIVVGDEFDYTIIVSNTVKDSSPLENVTVEDVLPEGTDFVDGVIKVLDKDNNEITHTIDNQNDRGFKLTLSEVAYGEDIKITFKVKANGKKLGENINEATVTDPEDSENPKHPTAMVNVIPKGILAAEKAADPNRLKIGEEFDYTITVSNSQEGSKPFKDVIVSDVLPAGIEFVDGKIKVDGVEEAEAENNGFEVILPEVAYGTPVKVSFKAKAMQAGTFENIAIVKDDLGNEIHPTASVEVIPKGILKAAKTASADKVMIGDEYEYTITVSNDQAGSSPLKDVTVKDTLPEGIEFVDGEIRVDGVAEANAVGDHFEVTLSEVAHGSPVKVSFMVRATNEAANTVTNIATVTSQESEEKPDVDVDVVRGSVEITKVDNELAEDGNRVTLEGAKFALYQCPEADSPIESCGDPIKELTTGSDGKILFEDLESGYYRLVETQAPEGYSLLTKPIDLGLIDVDRYEIQEDVINYKTGWELPTTGGMGTYWFYSLGVLFMLVALYATRKMRKADL